MLINLYCLRDRLTGYKGPVIKPNDEAAKREFRMLVEKDPMGQDYELYKVGTFNDENGEIIPNVPEYLTE